MKTEYYFKLSNLILPLVVSSFVMFLSFDNNLWLEFWRAVNVPSQLPPFSDLDAINDALLSKKEGYNPYIENPNAITQGKYLYPSIWLYLFDFLHLNNSTLFKVFNFLLIYFYVFILIDLVRKFNNKKLILPIILFFFSTNNFLLLERLNIEIIVFSITYLAVISNKKILKILFFFASIILKIFPFFSIFIFINNKKVFYSVLFSLIIYFVIMWNEIEMMKVNYPEYALIIAYGVTSIAKGIYYYSVDLGYFINDENYNLFKYSMIFLASVYVLFFSLIKFKFGEKKLNQDISLEEQFFLSGGGIFLGTFLISASIDYRLIFIILTIPYILKIESKNLKIIFFVCYVISINSFIFEGGNRYTITYFFKALFVYSSKIYMFTFIAYIMGSILNKYIKIKF